MKKTLLFIVTAIISAGLFAQLSTVDDQILYLSFDDDTELTLNEQEIDVLDEVDVDAEDGIYGGAVSFNGTSSFIVMDNIEDWNHGMDWTFSMWIKATGDPQDFWGIMSFSGYSGDPSGDYFDDDALVAGLKLGSEEGIFNLDISWLGGMGGEPDALLWDDGEWHHLVITYAPALPEMTMYLDGELYGGPEGIDIVGTIEADELPASLDDDVLKLGVAGAGWGPSEEFPDIMYFEGLMDDVRLFNIPLTPEDVSELFAYVPTGVRDIDAHAGLSVYPNPASDFIQIDTDSKHISIYNSVGSLVQSMENYRGERISVSHLSDGIYMIKTDDATTKVIIQ